MKKRKTRSTKKKFMVMRHSRYGSSYTIIDRFTSKQAAEECAKKRRKKDPINFYDVEPI
jgi:hypothetical protein